ncbi:HlyD family type I secretion periplasmic adaptor subunit [Desulfobaculum xiamenense]|nr:HlyD family type I secretion periplasmic adaptor subunit [Desulfobaculum xiamenense]
MRAGNGGPGDEANLAARMFLWLCAAGCAAFLVWAALFRLDIVSMAQGEVIPSTKLKSVQHLEGGIVREILVREGDAVTPGQSLVILEETSTGASVEELAVRTTSLTAEVARLDAQARMLNAPEFPEGFAKEHPDLAEQAQRLFAASRSLLESELAEQRENVVQREQDIKEIHARNRNNAESLRLVREQIALSDELLRDNLTTRYKHLAFLREQSQLVSKIEQDRAALPRAESALAEAREKLARIERSYREDAAQELRKARQELEEFTQRLLRYKDSLRRTVIRSPVEGVVKTLHIVTIGGVVKPGMTIVDIVPSSDRLVVEAHLPISDIGYVQEGQSAIVRLASQDAARFGKLPGRVVQVSPDTFTTPEGQTFYSVRIETDGDSFRHGEFEYKLIPGMLVLAYIHTGQRTVLEYLTDPFLGSMGQAMQER